VVWTDSTPIQTRHCDDVTLNSWHSLLRANARMFMRVETFTSSSLWRVGRSRNKWPWTLTLTSQKLTVTFVTAAEHLWQISWKLDFYVLCNHNRLNKRTNQQTRPITIAPGGGTNDQQTCSAHTSAGTNTIRYHIIAWDGPEIRHLLLTMSSDYGIMMMKGVPRFWEWGDRCQVLKGCVQNILHPYFP